MTSWTMKHPLALEIDTMPRALLQKALRDGRVEMNDSASILLSHPVFDCPEPQRVTLVECSVTGLGLAVGGKLSEIFAAAEESGLRLCPPTTAPYLRLALASQPTAADTVMSSGRAPSGSLTIASPPLHSDPEYPKGFYLRVVTDQSWLRGYRCDEEHRWDENDRFVFAR